VPRQLKKTSKLSEIDRFWNFDEWASLAFDMFSRFWMSSEIKPMNFEEI